MSSPSRPNPPFPESLKGLPALATNLWWSWSRQARSLLHEIDPLLWRQTFHNAVELLQRVAPERLNALAADPAFVGRYQDVERRFAAVLKRDQTWFGQRFPEHVAGTIAYFCAEFGLHSSVPFYSGGLGVLAGDHCKTASDLGVPVAGIGLMYTRGYFDQSLTIDGWQEDADEVLEHGVTPLMPVLDQDGKPVLVVVPTFNGEIHVGAWKLMVGSVPIYLLDTDIEQNAPENRGLTHRLYTGGPEFRLRQEWLLGVGGVRLLRRLGIAPVAWHANEGHATFMMVERLREAIVSGVSWTDAVEAVRATSLFTTHTPVPAGHDQFDRRMVTACLDTLWNDPRLDKDALFELGRHPENGDVFHMTAAAIRLSGAINGVSAMHGRVTRRMWHSLWPAAAEEEVPIGHVTNGVHLNTWMADSVKAMLDRELGTGWITARDDPTTWRRVRDIDPALIWGVHCKLKQDLFDFIREDARRRWRDHWPESSRVAGAGLLLSPDALTIGFARRFATYKRATLPFRDADRLHRILTNARRPVQLVFAGKAHPADDPGKHILQQVYQRASDAHFEGRVTFLEDYDMHIAHRLVQGVDLWLNLPRTPLEACGTSGMKAALNGIPQIGTLDGWWDEGFVGTNGWAIPHAGAAEDVDAHDAEHVYRILESEVVPKFYDRDSAGVPLQWVAMMLHAISEAGARFSGSTMMQQYVTKYYIPCMQASDRDRAS